MSAPVSVVAFIFMDLVRSILLHGKSSTGENSSEIKFPMVKSYPNEEFSVSITMIFDVDSNCVHPRSCRAQGLRHSHNSNKILEILRKLTSWNKVS